MTSELVLLAHCLVCQNVNGVTSVQFSYVALYDVPARVTSFFVTTMLPTEFRQRAKHFRQSAQNLNFVFKFTKN